MRNFEKFFLATNLTIGILLAIDFLINLAFTLRAWSLKKSATASDLNKLCEVNPVQYFWGIEVQYFWGIPVLSILVSSSYKTHSNALYTIHIEGTPAACVKWGLGGEIELS